MSQRSQRTEFIKCQYCYITLCNNLQYPVYIVGNPIPSDNKELKELEDWAIDRIEDITKLIHYQPINIVDRAFESNGKPKFDIILSYEEEKKKYKYFKPTNKSKEKLEYIQKLKDNKSKEKELEEAIEKLNLDDFKIEEIEENGINPSRCLGYYKIYGRYGRPEVVLLLKNIYNLYKTDDKEQKRKDSVTLTYIHEFMHAVMHVHTNNEFIEEPLAEMGMLCFVHDAYANLATTADEMVEVKQKDASICHYGFGKYLFDTLLDPEYGWSVGNLMKQYIIMSEALSDCFEYEKYFLAGYPNGSLQNSALKKLFKILRLNPIQANIPDGKETVYEWSKGNNA